MAADLGSPLTLRIGLWAAFFVVVDDGFVVLEVRVHVVEKVAVGGPVYGVGFDEA